MDKTLVCPAFEELLKENSDADLTLCLDFQTDAYLQTTKIKTDSLREHSERVSIEVVGIRDNISRIDTLLHRFL